MVVEQTEKKIKLSTWQVLRNKFPAEECVLIEEVSDASGFSRSRSLDYMLINLWNSRGLSITGIEKKSNRGDWLKELKDPAKQENHFKHCDYFYLLTDKDDVAKIEEIPVGWGWYHINGSQILKTMKAAPKLNALPIERSLFCAILRRAADKSKYVHIDSIEAKIEERSEHKKLYYTREAERKSTSYDDLKKKVDEFEAASGVQISNGWRSEATKIGEAVRVIMHHGIDSYIENITRIKNNVKTMYEGIEKNISLLLNEQNPERSVATKMPNEQKDDKKINLINQ